METKNREKLLLILTGACLGLFILNWVIISPLTDAYHARTKQIADLHKKIDDGAAMIRRDSVIRDRWSHMMTNTLSASPTVAERQLFDAFDRWVRDAHVTQGSFKPQLRQTDDNYSVMDCHADVTGDYLSVIHFLYNLESDPTGLQITGVSLTSRDDRGRQVSLSLDLSGLLLPPPTPPNS